MDQIMALENDMLDEYEHELDTWFIDRGGWTEQAKRTWTQEQTTRKASWRARFALALSKRESK